MEKEIWGLIGIILGIIVKGVFDIVKLRMSHDHDKERFRSQNLAKENIKELLMEMLNHRKYTDRTFSALKKRIGGYSDHDIRKMLMEVGAQKVRGKSDGREMWYLTERQEERNKRRNRL